MQLKDLLYEKKNKIATITLNRPERGNAFRDETHDDLREVWRDVRSDPDVWVAIFTGAGARHFSTGMDVRATAEKGGMLARQATLTSNPGLTAFHNDVWKPVICAINGTVAGGGFHFVVDADINICSENATFLEPHVSVGQVGVFEPIGLLIRNVPMEWVLRMALLGRTEVIDAKKALELGIVSEVVPQDKLMARARELAERITENSPATVMATKKAIWHAREVGYWQACRDGWEQLAAHWNHPDNQEGPKAFAEKRKPQWANP